MMDMDALKKKSACLKSALARYNEYSQFANKYKESGSLDSYVIYIERVSTTFSESILEKYEKLIYQYRQGNKEPLLADLYEKLLAADEYKNKISSELKSMLCE